MWKDKEAGAVPSAWLCEIHLCLYIVPAVVLFTLAIVIDYCCFTYGRISGKVWPKGPPSRRRPF